MQTTISTKATNYLLIDQMFAYIQLAESQLVVIFVVENIHQVGKERVDILQNKPQTN